MGINISCILFITRMDLIKSIEPEDSGRCMKWTSDGKLLAIKERDFEFFIFDMLTGKVLSMFKTYVSILRVFSWSPAANFVVFSRDSTDIRICDTENKTTKRMLRRHPDASNAVAWSPDEKMVAVGITLDTVCILDMHSKSHLAKISCHYFVVSAVWSPDGRTLALGYENGHVHFWDAYYKRTLDGITLHERRVYALAWSPDGKRIACGGKPHVVIWDTNSRKSTMLVHNYFTVIDHIMWSSDGKNVIFRSVIGECFVCNVFSNTCIFKFTSHDDPIWTPDATILTARHDWKLQLWKFSRSKPHFFFFLHLLQLVLGNHDLLDLLL